MNKQLALTCIVALVALHTALSVDVETKKYRVTSHHGKHYIKGKWCNDLSGWKNRWGQADCSMVRKKNYCYDGEPVYSTTRVFRSRNTWPRSSSGVNMLDACCQCGGGVEKMNEEEKKKDQKREQDEKTKQEGDKKKKAEQDQKKKAEQDKKKKAEQDKKNEENAKRQQEQTSKQEETNKKRKEESDKKTAEQQKKKKENGPAKPVDLVVHYISHKYKGLNNVKCYDEPGWRSSSLLGTQDCAYVRSKFYCKDGQYWRRRALFHKFNTWPKSPEGMSMMDACCQCGGGSMKAKGSQAQKDREYQRKAEEVGKKLHEQKVKWNEAKKSLENHVIKGNLCFDLPGWTGKFLGGCEVVKQKQYCREGHYNRRKAYFHIRRAYPKNNEGVNMLDACCQCGGGTLHKDKVNKILKNKKVAVPRRVQQERTLAGFL